jgi:hypothetical protein
VGRLWSGSHRGFRPPFESPGVRGIGGDEGLIGLECGCAGLLEQLLCLLAVAGSARDAAALEQEPCPHDRGVAGELPGLLEKLRRRLVPAAVERDPGELGEDLRPARISRFRGESGPQSLLADVEIGRIPRAAGACPLLRSLRDGAVREAEDATAAVQGRDSEDARV